MKNDKNKSMSIALYFFGNEKKIIKISNKIMYILTIMYLFSLMVLLISYFITRADFLIKSSIIINITSSAILLPMFARNNKSKK